GAAQIDAAEPAAEMEGHPRHTFSDALGDQRLHLGLGAVLGARDPYPGAVLDAAILGVGRADLDEHVLLQLGQPFVRARLLAAALIFDEAAGGKDEREAL